MHWGAAEQAAVAVAAVAAAIELIIQPRGRVVALQVQTPLYFARMKCDSI